LWTFPSSGIWSMNTESTLSVFMILVKFMWVCDSLVQKSFGFRDYKLGRGKLGDLKEKKSWLVETWQVSVWLWNIAWMQELFAVHPVCHWSSAAWKSPQYSPNVLLDSKLDTLLALYLDRSLAHNFNDLS
jgi:hypothetical protein